MKTRSKLCWTGAGLLIAGTGVAVAGVALLISAAVSWTTERIVRTGPKRLDRTFQRLESVSGTIGSAAGRMQHHVAKAARVARKAGEGAIKGLNEALAQK